MNRFQIGTIALISLLTVCAAENQEVYARSKRGHVNLTGQWRVTSAGFHSITPSETGCHRGPYPGSGDAVTASSKLDIIQKRDGSIIIPNFRTWESTRNPRGSGPLAISNAKVSGKVLSFQESGGGFTDNFKGTISPDGNKITGTDICQHSSGKATASAPFTLVRLTQPKIPTVPGKG